MLLLLSALRLAPRFDGYAFAINSALMFGGFLLAGYQLTGYALA